MRIIACKLLADRAKLPLRAHQSDAGFDLFAIEAGTIDPGRRGMVRTGISLMIPEGYYGRLAPRSGLAVKNGIDVLAGVIDAGYRDEIRVVLLNTGKAPFDILPGDRIAQLIIERVDQFNIVAVDSLDDSDRGINGFGSTGK